MSSGSVSGTILVLAIVSPPLIVSILAIFAFTIFNACRSERATPEAQTPPDLEAREPLSTGPGESDASNGDIQGTGQVPDDAGHSGVTGPSGVPSEYLGTAGEFEGLEELENTRSNPAGESHNMASYDDSHESQRPSSFNTNPSLDGTFRLLPPPPSAPGSGPGPKKAVPETIPEVESVSYAVSEEASSSVEADEAEPLLKAEAESRSAQSSTAQSSTVQSSIVQSSAAQSSAAQPSTNVDPNLIPQSPIEADDLEVDDDSTCRVA